MCNLPVTDHPSPRVQLRAAVDTLAEFLVNLTTTPEEVHALAAVVHRLHVGLGEPDAQLALHLQRLLGNADRDLVDRGFYALRLTQATDRL